MSPPNGLGLQIASQRQFENLSRLRQLFPSHGNERRCKAAEADQVSSSVQPEGGHEEGECRSDEEVGGHQDLRKSSLTDN